MPQIPIRIIHKLGKTRKSKWAGETTANNTALDRTLLGGSMFGVESHERLGIIGNYTCILTKKRRSLRINKYWAAVLIITAKYIYRKAIELIQTVGDPYRNAGLHPQVIDWGVH